MNTLDPAEIGEEVCKCGRSAERRHCAICGKTNFYALKKKISRPHPRTGAITEISIFRCRSCNSNFDDLQWMFDCVAPKAIFVQRKEKIAQTKDELMQRVIRGEVFDTNEKRHFKRIVGIHYEDARQMYKNIDDMRIKAQFKKLGLDTTNIETSNSINETKPDEPTIIKKDGKTIFKIPGLE